MLRRYGVMVDMEMSLIEVSEKRNKGVHRIGVDSGVVHLHICTVC